MQNSHETYFPSIFKLDIFRWEIYQLTPYMVFIVELQYDKK